MARPRPKTSTEAGAAPKQPSPSPSPSPPRTHRGRRQLGGRDELDDLGEQLGPHKLQAAVEELQGQRRNDARVVREPDGAQHKAARFAARRGRQRRTALRGGTAHMNSE